MELKDNFKSPQAGSIPFFQPLEEDYPLSSPTHRPPSTPEYKAFDTFGSSQYSINYKQQYHRFMKKYNEEKKAHQELKQKYQKGLVLFREAEQRNMQNIRKIQRLQEELKKYQLNKNIKANNVPIVKINMPKSMVRQRQSIQSMMECIQSPSTSKQAYEGRSTRTKNIKIVNKSAIADRKSNSRTIVKDRAQEDESFGSANSPQKQNENYKKKDQQINMLVEQNRKLRQQLNSQLKITQLKTKSTQVNAQTAKKHQTTNWNSQIEELKNQLSFKNHKIKTMEKQSELMLKEYFGHSTAQLNKIENHALCLISNFKNAFQEMSDQLSNKQQKIIQNEKRLTKSQEKIGALNAQIDQLYRLLSTKNGELGYIYDSLLGSRHHE